MDDPDWLAERFEEHHSHLRAVAEQALNAPPPAGNDDSRARPGRNNRTYPSKQS
jgi:hypothetical protein